ncbi:MAG: hypothetical protein HY717_04605 [Planctomycetes bacterium]|nr:hypothetical protein [Planctomycetota bacterium]
MTSEAGAKQPSEIDPIISSSVPEKGALEDKTGHQYQQGCLTQGCHARLKETRWIHGPISVGGCRVCHQAEGKPEEHHFKLTRSKEELCLFCHPRSAKHKSVHEPYGKLDCSACHNPHGGDNKSFLLARNAGELCAKCHQKHKVAYPHAPVEAGDCLACHAAHQSNQDHLLLREDKQLCLGCHRSLRDLLKGEAPVHQALVQGCLFCHSAHGGDFPAMVSHQSRALCQNCHQNVTDGLTSARSVHGAVDDEKACMRCHAPHTSVFDRLLRDPPAELCIGCHDCEIALPSGRKIGNIHEQISTAASVHGPVKEKNCLPCHFPHSSPNVSLLRGEYPENLYSQFTESTYDLCFHCHDRRLVTDERSTRFGFRNGDRNLHRVHVYREKGRACGICHEPHASKLVKLLRESVSFGPEGWQLPINFVKTETGGSCTTACHKKYSYDKVNPPAAPAQGEGHGEEGKPR